MRFKIIKTSIYLVLLQFVQSGCGKNQSITIAAVKGASLRDSDKGTLVKKNTMASEDATKVSGTSKIDEIAATTKVPAVIDVKKIIQNDQMKIVKSSVQIYASVELCLGVGRTKILPFMVFDPKKSVAENKNAFLTVAGATQNLDIVKTQAELLDGKASLTATAVRNSTLSLSYLLALRNIANVVAYNCSVSESELCSCKNQESAQAMLKRCLPQHSLEAIASVQKEFAETCSKDAQSGTQIAISSLIASPQFARVE